MIDWGYEGSYVEGGGIRGRELDFEGENFSKEFIYVCLCWIVWIFVIRGRIVIYM